MKSLLFGAGALLFSTSAIAAVVHVKEPAGSTVMPAMTANEPAIVSAMAWQDVPLPARSAAIQDGMMSSAEKGDAAALSSAGLDMSNAALTPKPLPIHMASASTGGKAADEGTTALAPKPVPVRTASMSTGGKAGEGVQMASASQSQATPRRSARSTWRPCNPGPGDEHCIQLYDAGARESYAAWRDNRIQMAAAEQSGAIQVASHDEAAAGGGLLRTASYDDSAVPEVDTVLTDEEQQNLVHASATVDGGSALGEPDAAALAMAAAVTEQEAYDGVGGPIEGEGYPACASRSDDFCQQGS